MNIKKQGFKELRRKINKIAPKARAEFKITNKKNADDVAYLAKVLISSRSGQSRTLIKTYAGPNGGTIIDFGPLAKILEGGTEERFTKTGAYRGRGPARPFVNPSFKATAKKRRSRNRRTLKKVLKDA